MHTMYPDGVGSYKEYVANLRAPIGVIHRYEFNPDEPRDAGGEWTSGGSDKESSYHEQVAAKNSIPKLAKALGITAAKVVWGATKIAARLGVTAASILAHSAAELADIHTGGSDEPGLFRMWDALVGKGEWADKPEESDTGSALLNYSYHDQILRYAAWTQDVGYTGAKGKKWVSPGQRPRYQDNMPGTRGHVVNKGGVSVAAPEPEQAAQKPMTPAAKKGKKIPKVMAEAPKPKGKAKKGAKAAGKPPLDQPKPGEPNVAAMEQKLAPHAAHPLTPADVEEAKTTFAALQHHHGEKALHRLEELINGVHSALRHVAHGDTAAYGTLSKRLRGYQEMLNWHKQDQKKKEQAEKAPEGGYEVEFEYRKPHSASGPFTGRGFVEDKPEIGGLIKGPFGDAHVTGFKVPEPPETPSYEEQVKAKTEGPKPPKPYAEEIKKQAAKSKYPEDTLSPKEFKSLKMNLKKAVKANDADKIIAECDRAMAIFEKKGYPDNWHDWERAKDDAVYMKARYNNPDRAYQEMLAERSKKGQSTVAPMEGEKPESPQNMHGQKLALDERGWPKGTESWAEPAAHEEIEIPPGEKREKEPSERQKKLIQDRIAKVRAEKIARGEQPVAPPVKPPVAEPAPKPTWDEIEAKGQKLSDDLKMGLISKKKYNEDIKAWQDEVEQFSPLSPGANQPATNDEDWTDEELQQAWNQVKPAAPAAKPEPKPGTYHGQTSAKTPYSETTKKLIEAYKKSQAILNRLGADKGKGFVQAENNAPGSPNSPPEAKKAVLPTETPEAAKTAKIEQEPAKITETGTPTATPAAKPAPDVKADQNYADWIAERRAHDERAQHGGHDVAPVAKAKQSFKAAIAEHEAKGQKMIEDMHRVKKLVHGEKNLAAVDAKFAADKAAWEEEGKKLKEQEQAEAQSQTGGDQAAAAPKPRKKMTFAPQSAFEPEKGSYHEQTVNHPKFVPVAPKETPEAAKPASESKEPLASTTPAEPTGSVPEPFVKKYVDYIYRDSLSSDKFKAMPPEEQQRILTRETDKARTHLNEMAKRIGSKDTKLATSAWLHPSNKMYRALFTELTGIKLPPGAKETADAVANYVGKDKVQAHYAEGAKKVAEERAQKQALKEAEAAKQDEKFAGFTKGLTPYHRATAIKMLDKKIMSGGQPHTLQSLVDSKIGAGAVVRPGRAGSKEGRWLQTPDGNLLTEKQIGKIAMNYAEHKLAQQKAGTPSTPVKTQTPVQPKAPHQMTGKEYAAQYEKEYGYPPPRENHIALIEKALKAGHTIPRAVQEEYPKRFNIK